MCRRSSPSWTRQHAPEPSRRRASSASCKMGRRPTQPRSSVPCGAAPAVLPSSQPTRRTHMTTQLTEGTAAVQGPLWSERADDWATVHEHNLTPVYDAVLDLVHAAPGVSILEVGCGGGTALALAADRGAGGFQALRYASVTSSSCPTTTPRSTS